MQVGAVAEIHRYPVKSMQGERLGSVRVGEDGLRGDRSWATRDERRDAIEGARKLPALLSCAARFPEAVAERGALPVPHITLPDGRSLSADDPKAAEELTQLLGTPVSLWPRLPESETAHYRRGSMDHADIQEELRAIFGRLPEEPLPDLGLLPREALLSATIPGTYFDCYPLFLLSKASLASLAAARPETRFDARRFRPNLLLETDADGFPENDWVGQQLRIGGAVFRVTVRCPRCVMTTHGLADLPRDPGVMRALVKENGGDLGVYASVETSGQIREGDPVELIA